MTTIALSCGNEDSTPRSDRDGVRWVELPARPGKSEVDPVLTDVGDRLLVRGTDADLAAVVLRLLRRGLLSEVEVAYVPVESSPVSALWSIPVGSAAFELAHDGVPGPVPLIRDDSGGVLLGSGVIAPITGQAFCEDQRVLNGSAARLEISPDPEATPLPEPTADPLSAHLVPAEDGLRVNVVRRRVFRQVTETTRGRAFQAHFQPVAVVSDGVTFPRPVRKWGWYRHTEDLLLVRP